MMFKEEYDIHAILKQRRISDYLKAPYPSKIDILLSKKDLIY